eukprot:TRINITY_DN3569_c0_g1_i6.p2 TRINITY_DN3569_c0_g1~~TRINITY_DN3569_c0_g1_i6.p2  ORF type:complete len:121 (-),score=39.45 TRINITY_DN3569_c0_g1_i6:58-420(-)
MCMPMGTPKEELVSRCSTAEGYTPSTDPEVHTETLTAGDIVLILLIVFVILCCVLTIVYYRYRFCKDNEPPFQVPEWCPAFIFPRSTFLAREVTPGYTEKDKEMKQQINPVGYYLYGDDN